jgi:hypothetical protein
MEPASSIIKKLGGEAIVSKVTKTAYTAPYRWQYPRARGGTGGIVPQRHHRKLLTFAQQNDIGLKAEDFLPPMKGSRRSREVARVAA